MKEEIKLEPQKRISPSSIIEYRRCPRCYFYRYIAKLKTPPNIHLIKGIIVHKVLEDLFRGYKPNLEEHMINLFNKAWESNEQNIKDLEMKPEEVELARQDCLFMINDYYATLKRKMEGFVKIGKAENESHAYYLLKPKFREKFYEDKDLHVCGYLDRIHEDYNGFITIGDYKTSSKYGIGLPENYKLQLAIYALLYKLNEQKMPDFTSVIFLRYGEEFILEVTPTLMKYALDIVNETWEKTRSIDINDYPPADGNDSKWCPFLDIHDGTADWKAKVRQQKLIDNLSKTEEVLEDVE